MKSKSSNIDNLKCTIPANWEKEIKKCPAGRGKKWSEAEIAFVKKYKDKYARSDIARIIDVKPVQLKYLIDEKLKI